MGSLSFYYVESWFDCTLLILCRVGLDADENPEDLSLEVKTPFCHLFSNPHFIRSVCPDWHLKVF